MALVDQDRTLGHLDAEGLLPPATVLTLEKTFGPTWRGVTVAESQEALKQAAAESDREVAAREAWMPFVNVFNRRIGEEGAMSDALVAAAVQEVYGDYPTREQMKSVLEVVENFYRLKRGEKPLAPDA